MEAAFEDGEKIVREGSFSVAISLIFARLIGRKAFSETTRHFDEEFPNRKFIASISPNVGVQIYRLDDYPQEGLATLVTYGLSRYAMKVEKGCKKISCEIAITVEATCDLPIELAISELARLMLYSRRIFVPGMKIQYDFSSEFGCERVTPKGVYCWSGVWLSPQVCEIACTTLSHVHLIELLPITPAELVQIDSNKNEFISQTVDGHIDLLNFERV